MKCLPALLMGELSLGCIFHVGSPKKMLRNSLARPLEALTAFSASGLEPKAEVVPKQPSLEPIQ